MDNSLRKSVIIAAGEANYAEDANPTAANGIESSAPSPGFNFEKLEKKNIRGTLSPGKTKVGEKYKTINFETELKGANDSGDPGKKTHYDCLLEACRISSIIVTHLPISGGVGTFQAGEGVTGGTSSATAVVVRVFASYIDVANITGTFEAGEQVTGGISGATANTEADPMLDLTREYRPTSEPGGSSSVYYYVDTRRHKVLGAVGDVGIEIKVNQLPKLKFSMTGMYQEPVDVTPLTGVTFEEHWPPDVVGVDFTVGGHTPVGSDGVTLNMGNTVTRKKDIVAATGIREFRVSARAATGKISKDMEALSDFNVFAKIAAGTTDEIRMMVPGQPGNRINLIVPTAQFVDVNYEQDEDAWKEGLDFTCPGWDNDFCLQVG